MPKLITKLVPIIFVLLLAGCGTTSTITLKNSSSKNISNVKIYASGSLIWQGDIAAGKSVSASFTVDKDGALRVTGNINSTILDTDYLGYITPNDGIYHIITYEGQGVTSYDYSTKN